MVTSPTALDSLTLDVVRAWSTRQVVEWLDLNKMGKYGRIFADNDITGDVLLDLNQAFLKDMRVAIIGDRLRLMLCINNLRKAVLANKYQQQLLVHSPVARSYSIVNRSRTGGSVGPDASTAPSSGSSSPVLNSPSTPIPLYRSLSQRSGQLRRRDDSSTDLQSPLESPLSGISHPIKRSASRTGSSGTLANDSSAAGTKRIEAGIMGMDFVKLNCVKVTGDDDQTRIVNLVGATDAKAIIEKVLSKFNNAYEESERYCLFVASSESGAVHALSDVELVEICRDPSRAERERLFLRKKFINLPSASNPKSKINKLESFVNDRASLDPISSYKSEKKLNKFFGERPPSELIASNLLDFFPKEKIRKYERRRTMSLRKQQQHQSGAYSDMSSYSNDPFEDERSILSRTGSSIMANSSFMSSRFIPNPNRSNVLDTTLSGPLYRAPTSRLPPVPHLLRPKNEVQENSQESSIIHDESMVTKEKNENELIDDVSRRLSTYSTTSLLRNKPEPIIVTSPTGNTRELIEELVHLPSMEGEQSPLTSEPMSPVSPTSPISNDLNGPSKWIKGKLIGQGSFGNVYLGLNPETAEVMAVKQVELPSSDSTANQERKKMMVDAMQHEINLLKDFNHPNIVRYLGTTTESLYLNIFLEYVAGGSIHANLMMWGRFEEPMIRRYLKQILLGLDYLHQREIIHRDIKAANILVDNGKIRISDFGISKKIEDDILTLPSDERASLQGSVFWMAPEVVKQMRYTRKSDVWGLGCLLIEMFTAQHPWPKSTTLEALFKIGSATVPDIPADISPDAHNFLIQTFRLDYLDRPNADVLLGHPFALQSHSPTSAQTM